MAKVFGDRVREARMRRGWSGVELANRLADVTGARSDPSAVSRVERAVPKLLSVRDVLAYAVALDVAPVNLIVPLEDDLDVHIQVTPEITVPAPFVREWIRGAWGLPAVGRFKGTDNATFLAESADSDLRARIRDALRGQPSRAVSLADLLRGTTALEPDEEVIDAFVRKIRRVEEGSDG